MIPKFGGLLTALMRRKDLSRTCLEESHLDRCLSTTALTLLGIGSTLGLGIYVLAGEVASRTAGPSVSISFAIAATASVFAGLCYAEFGARVPKSGSAYVYSYVTVGEFMAFVIGWNLVLEYVIGTASVARGYSGYIDSIADGAIKEFWRHNLPIDISGLSAYPDFLAFGITLSLTLMLVYGVKESTRFNSIFTGVNLCVVVFIVIAGSFHVDLENWRLPANVTLPRDAGTGGFFPFGFSGMMSGAATCFYGFIGFDVIATTGEEAKNPQKSIPISIVLSLFFVFIAYFSISTIQTLMFPYYDQTEAITNGAPLPYVFAAVGWPVAKWIISIGALTGLSTSLLGAMFPLPRVLYSMAQDGVIFRFLGTINSRTKTPLIATLISGLIAACMAAFFDVKELADMMSIGTLLAYTLVAISVLILRYSPDAGVTTSLPIEDVNSNEFHEMQQLDAQTKENNNDSAQETSITNVPIFRQCFNLDCLGSPTVLSSYVATSLIVTISFVMIFLNYFLVNFERSLYELQVPILTLVAITVFFLGVLITALALQPRCTKALSFEVPFVPYIPILSMFINFYLMLQLSTTTWIRFVVWMIIGLTIYFGYGIWNSNERNVESSSSNGKKYQSAPPAVAEPDSISLNSSC